MNTVKLYLHSMKMLLKSQLQYPWSFCLQTIAQIVMEGGEMMAVLLIVNRFQSLNQWTGGNLLFFFGIMSITFYLTECFGRGITGNFAALIRSGNLDTFFLRPRGIMTQVICHAIDPRRIGCIAVGVAALVMGCSQSNVIWTWPKIFLFTEAVLFGMLLILGLFLIEAVFAVHSVKSIELVNAVTYGGRSACQYPIDVFPGPLRVLFGTLAPFALVLQVPSAVILDKPLMGIDGVLAFICPLSGLMFFTIMYFVFQKAMKFYRSTGS